MLSKILKQTNMSVKLISLLVLIFSILVAKSIYLISFVSVLTIMIIIYVDEDVKSYVQLFKNIVFWLLFLIFIYIIIYKNIINTLIFSYKLLLSISIVHSFSYKLTFDKLHSAVYGVLKIFKKNNIEKLSYDISLNLCSIKYLIYSGENIKYLQSKKLKNRFSIKYYLFPKILFCNNKVKEKELNLILNNYKLYKEKNNFISMFVLFIVLVLFICVVVKEVIL